MGLNVPFLVVLRHFDLLLHPVGLENEPTMHFQGRVAEWLRGMFFKPDSLGSIQTRDTVG